MNTIRNNFDNILYHDLRPWIDANNVLEKFESKKLVKLGASPKINALYSIDFYRAPSAKARYYVSLINSEAIAICNDLYAAMHEDDHAMRQQYFFDEFMLKKLPGYLTDIIEIIKEQRFFLEFIDPKLANYDIKPEHKTNTYIIQYLKLTLVIMYLEVQAAFSSFVKGFPLNETDIYDKFFNQNLPDNSYLLPLEQSKVAEKLPADPIEEEADGRVSRKSFTYTNLDSASDKLTDLFKALKENELIAKDNPLASFKRAFSGKEVSSPVVWNGSPEEFHYFIHLLHNKYELVAGIKRSYWKVACKCFLKADGTQFNSNQLKVMQKPEKTAAQIDKLVMLLK